MHGIYAYLFIMIFLIVSVGIAKIILKIAKKENYNYINWLTFCIIGLILSTLWIIFNIRLEQKYLEIFICLIINIIVFRIFKYIKKVFKTNKYIDTV